MAIKGLDLGFTVYSLEGTSIRLTVVIVRLFYILLILIII